MFNFVQELRLNEERLKNVNKLACELSEKTLGNADDVPKRVEDLNGRFVLFIVLVLPLFHCNNFSPGHR